MSKILLTIVCLSTLSLTACLDGGGGGTSTAGGTSTPSPETPSNPLPSQNVMQAAGCTVTQLSNGVQFDCNGTTGVVYNGQNGAAGATGAQGPQGIQGTTGAAGSQGPQGPQGAQGPQGIQGVAGADGADGVGGAGMAVYNQMGQLLSEFTLVGGNINMTSGVTVVLYSKTNDILVPYTNNGVINGNSALYFEFAGCTGRVYQSSVPVMNSVFRWIRSGGGFPDEFYKTKNGGKRNFTVRSAMNSAGTCSPAASTLDWLEIEPYTLPSQIPTQLNMPLSFAPAQ